LIICVVLDEGCGVMMLPHHRLCAMALLFADCGMRVAESADQRMASPSQIRNPQSAILNP
jgi:hypothetical protein